MVEITRSDLEMIESLGKAQADAQREMKKEAWKIIREEVKCHEDDYKTLKVIFNRIYDMAVRDCLINMITVRSALLDDIMEGGDPHDGE